MPQVETHLDPSSLVGEVVLNNPRNSNALTHGMLEELPRALKRLLKEGARVIVVHSIGVSKNFCAGLSLDSLSQSSASTGSAGTGCQARQRWAFRDHILDLQRAMTCFEECHVPVIAAVHGACVGAGVDLITACDIRVCTTSAKFCVKEVDLGIVADMGTLSRLPGIVGDGHARQLSLTGETIEGARAKEISLVSEALPSEDALLRFAMNMASTIASKSPVAIAGTKEVLLYHRDHGRTEDSLRYVATLNASLLPGNEDIQAILGDVLARRTPRRRFSRL